jgi:hypothetical protein
MNVQYARYLAGLPRGGSTRKRKKEKGADREITPSENVVFM